MNKTKSNPILLIMNNEENVQEVNKYCKENNIPLKAVKKGENIRGYNLNGYRPGMIILEGHLTGDGQFPDKGLDQTYWYLHDVMNSVEADYRLIPLGNYNEQPKKFSFKTMFNRV